MTGPIGSGDSGLPILPIEAIRRLGDKERNFLESQVVANPHIVCTTKKQGDSISIGSYILIKISMVDNEKILVESLSDENIHLYLHSNSNEHFVRSPVEIKENQSLLLKQVKGYTKTGYDYTVKAIITFMHTTNNLEAELLIVSSNDLTIS